MPTPEQMRLAYIANASTNPAVAAFRAFLTTGKAAEDAFYAWLAEPMTQLVVRAIEEMADNPPVVDKAAIETQYGVTSGLQIAAKLMTQPRRLFPEVLQDPKGQEPTLDKAYTATADSAIDNM